MKNLLLLLILVLPNIVLAEDELKRCESYRHKVLEPAVSFEERSADHGYRFVKDEKKALDFISKFEPRELQFQENTKRLSKARSTCQEVPYCENAVASFNFLRGLTYGMKNYNWASKTKEEAREKIWKYAHKVLDLKPNLLHLMMASNLLKILAAEKLIQKPTLEKISAFYSELELQDELLRKKAKLQGGDCKVQQTIRVEEEKLVNQFTEKLKGII